MIRIECDNLVRPKPDLHYIEARHYLSQGDSEISVIVQAYGRADKTKACVESILKYTDIEYKFYILDNGTQDNSIKELYESIDYKNKEYIRFTTNVTGVFALNRVFRSINSKYIVLVNNDIVVCYNWLSNLLACIKTDDKIGMVVPVSTNISNNQYEDLNGFSDASEMHEKAKMFNVSDSTKWEERIRLIPTATLYRREIFDVVGVYDVGFMHDFGDDDFTFRVRRAGYKLMLCRDTFVHHDHDQTALSAERNEILFRSREYFKEKYYGIDAWNDTTNYIRGFLDNICFRADTEHSILAYEVQCGASILEAKNAFRKQNIKVEKVKAVTSDAKYYQDLLSIANEVVCCDVEQSLLEEKNQYEVVILGKAVNSFKDPEKVLRTLLLNKTDYGCLVFSLDNVLDITSFFNMIGYSANLFGSYKVMFTIDDVYRILKESDSVKNVEITLQAHNIDEQTKQKFVEIIEGMNIISNKDEILRSLATQTYWIVVT